MTIYIIAFFYRATFWKNTLEYSAHWILYNCIQELWTYWIRMNILKKKIYKRVLKDVSEKYEGTEEFINSWTEEICSQEKLSVEESIFYFFSC